MGMGISMNRLCPRDKDEDADILMAYVCIGVAHMGSRAVYG